MNKNDHIILSSSELEHFTDQIIEISDKQLGENYLSKEQIVDYLSPNTDIYVLLAVKEYESIYFYRSPKKRTEKNNSVLVDELDIIGFSIYGKYTDKRLNNYLKLNKDEYPKQIQDKNVGIIRTIAIDPRYTGQGLGTEMVNETDELLDRLNIDVKFVVGWKSERGCHIENIITRRGYTRINEYKNYWRASSKNNGYRCKFCGEPPCSCNAVVFVK